MPSRKKKAAAGERDRLRGRRDAERSILAALSSFGDPLPAAHAIVSSPLGLHRYLTLAPAVRLAIRAAAQQRPPLASSGDMQELIRLSAARAGGLAHLEDAIPIDPRVPASAVFRERVYRLYPGMLERPLAALRTAELISRAVDAVLRQKYGFGVGDYVEVCLRHSERAVEVLAPSWDDGPLPDVGDLPAVTAGEIAAAKQVVEWTSLEPDGTEEHRRALAWATISVGQLDVDVDHGITGTCFGSALAVAGPGGLRLALPLPYIAEAWEYTARMLAIEAAGLSAQCRHNWLRIVRAEVARLLTTLRDAPPAGIAEGPAGPVAMLRFGQRHVLLFAVAADIGTGSIESAERALTAIAPGVRVRTGQGTYTLADDAEIVRVVVAAHIGPALVGITSDVALVTLEDMQWMVTNCERAEELFAFFFEDVVTNKDIHMFGWEPANTWQYWKANGQAIHRAGLPPTGIVVEPHQVGGQEWQESASIAPVEWALSRLALSSTRDLRAFDVTDGPVRILTPDNAIWALALLDQADPQHGALLAEVQRGEPPAPVSRFAFDMIGTICYVALHDTAAAAAALHECELDRLVISFEYDAAGDAIAVTSSADEIRFTWNAELLEKELEQPGFIQDQLGALLIETLSQLPTASEAVQAFAAVWRQAPRMLAVSEYEAPPQKAQNLVCPQSVPPWALSQANLRLARHLRDADEQPGQRDRAASRALELNVIVPWLRTQVNDQFSRFDRVAVLRRAARDIEAVTAARRTEQIQRRNRRSIPIARLRDEQTAPQDDQDSKLAQQSAVLATLLELALAADATGTTTPDDIEWHQLLALASLFVDSTARCDALLHDMSSDTITISDSYEVTTVSSDIAAIDMAAFNSARLRHSRSDPKQYEQHPAGPTSEEILAIVDPAMLADLGCTASTLMGACAVISAWPVTDQAPTADVPFDELHTAVAHGLGVDLAEAQAAINALTLSREGLQAERVQPWKVRSRDQRLTARPVVELDERTALLLPWNSQSSGTIIAGYVAEGLLPWPTSRLDQYPDLRKAIDQVRLSHTRILEDQVDAELRRLGFVVRSRIKPEDAHTIGLDSLPGEVDHIALCAEDGVLWVIDDKDLAPLFTPAEFARNIKQFFDERKGETTKLQAKIDVITNNINDVATKLKIAVPNSIRGLFITRNPIPAAFALSTPISFTTLRDLHQNIRAT